MYQGLVLQSWKRVAALQPVIFGPTPRAKRWSTLVNGAADSKRRPDLDSMDRRIAGRLSLEAEAIMGFCRRHHMARLAVFGSVLRDDFGPASDLDVLVEFEPGHVPGLAFFDMEEELSRIAGRPVDLNTAESLSPDFRDAVCRESVVLYDASRSAAAPAAHA